MNRREIKGRNCPQSINEQRFKLPSCFLTPESAERPKDSLQFGRVTPDFDRTSSVFLSPPSSSERSPVPNFSSKSLDGFPVLDLDIEDKVGSARSGKSGLSRSPLLPEDRIIGAQAKLGKVDVISELLALNADRICKNVCDHLNDSDIIRFASVCRRWRNCIRDFAYDRWRSYLRERKHYWSLRGKENFGSPSSHKSLSISRTPLLTINVNRTPCKEQVNKETATPIASTSSQTAQTPITRERRLCPKCTSPSNYKRVQDGHCQCEKCGLEFCSLCLRDMDSHSTELCNDITTAPQDRPVRKSRTRKVKSGQNKERLRRL